jgi:hypothetical protein
MPNKTLISKLTRELLITWQAISALAKFVRDETKDIILCEDDISFLESCFVEETGHYSTLLTGYL